MYLWNRHNLNGSYIVSFYAFDDYPIRPFEYSQLWPVSPFSFRRNNELPSAPNFQLKNTFEIFSKIFWIFSKIFWSFFRNFLAIFSKKFTYQWWSPCKSYQCWPKMARCDWWHLDRRQFWNRHHLPDGFRQLLVACFSFFPRGIGKLHLYSWNVLFIFIKKF